jgi:hypothetical protein
MAAVSAVLEVVPDQEHVLGADVNDSLEHRARRLPRVSGGDYVAWAQRPGLPEQDMVPRLERGGHAEPRDVNPLEPTPRPPGWPCEGGRRQEGTGEDWAGEDWAGEDWAGEDWAGEDWAGEDWVGAARASEVWTGNGWARDDWAGNDRASRKHGTTFTRLPLRIDLDIRLVGRRCHVAGRGTVSD